MEHLGLIKNTPLLQHNPERASFEIFFSWQIFQIQTHSDQTQKSLHRRSAKALQRFPFFSKENPKLACHPASTYDSYFRGSPPHPHPSPIQKSPPRKSGSSERGKSDLPIKSMECFRANFSPSFRSSSWFS